MSLFLWARLIRQLRMRGHGRRESGAFLLAKLESRRVSKFICYDDLDPTALDSGIIVFHGSGFVPLWEHCKAHGMTVVADVHTHRDSWTGQSEADRTHPMIGKPGHIGLIVPHYAQQNLLSLKDVGVYEYQGNHKWRTSQRNNFELTLLPWPR